MRRVEWLAVLAVAFLVALAVYVLAEDLDGLPVVLALVGGAITCAILSHRSR